MKDRTPEEFEAYMNAMENMEISGQAEHNARVREQRNNAVLLSENQKLRDEIQEINKSLRQQIADAHKSAKRSELIAWVSIAISAASLLVAFIALFR